MLMAYSLEQLRKTRESAAAQRDIFDEVPIDAPVLREVRDDLVLSAPEIPRMTSIPISAILQREGMRLRAVRPDRVKALADSIAELGLQTPISVLVQDASPVCTYGHDGKTY